MGRMIVLGSVLISDEVKRVCFSCDLLRCRGACCVEGDAGAPLEEEEISLLEDFVDEIKPFMTPEGIREVEKNGVFDYDMEGHFVTPLIEGMECAFIRFEEGIARCAIEQAFQEQKIPFPKPISCHLYPLRISHGPTGDRLNYHPWHICADAVKKGTAANMPLYRFLEEPLIRKYGKAWYDQLVTLLR